jgi:hypothetical protein
MTTVAISPSFSMSRVISRLFSALGRNFVTFLLLSVLLVGLPSAILAFIQLGAMSSLWTSPAAVFQNFFSPLSLSLALVGFLVAVAANSVLQGAVIHGVVSDLSGERASFGDCLSTGLRFLLPLIGIGVIAGIGSFLGALIFIVPGVILAMAWMVAAPAEVTERVGVLGALGRSLELTRNHRWAIFGLAVIFIIAQFIVQTVVNGVLSVGFGAGASASAFTGIAPKAFQNYLALQQVSSLIARTLLASVSSAGVATLYFELRETKEGVGAESLAKLFD